MAREGFIEVPGGRVWYRSVGEGGTPLLCLHGGPGFTHYYLEPLEALADRRQVIFYDQLGCGRSDRPEDGALWTVDRFVEELAAVRAALGLERLHLFGSSWGGMLAMQEMRVRVVHHHRLSHPRHSIPGLRSNGSIPNQRRASPYPLLT